MRLNCASFVGRCLSTVAAVCCVAGSLRAALPIDTAVPEGFQVQLVADDDLAHDVHCLTLDSRGRIVVSGPGYVRILRDHDGDGIADDYLTFADGPQSGAQGMYFDGHDLYCTGDGGLLRYRDGDGDGRADGPPELLLALKTGGEHCAHSIQRGPDGWWYVLLGNLAEVTEAHVTRSQSPVARPTGGVLMRLTPDFAGREVWADGFRNPYDFCFGPWGELLTFDSDGERDVSLPWYRPTRLFHVLAGCHAGWVTTSWKHPDTYPDMPPVVWHGGRGSPTGIVCYRHTGFPESRHDAVFSLDWTFGRIMAVGLQAQGAVLTGAAEDFLTARGQFGFAATDVDVTPAGDLVVSVGGRGTRGGVYRITWRGAPSPVALRAVGDELTFCLAAPQPLASWSRSNWLPSAQRLGPSRLTEAALDGERCAAQRVRAIEIITELFGGLEPSVAAALCGDPDPRVRARAVWSLGVHRVDLATWSLLAQVVDDTDPCAALAALEACLGHADEPGLDRVLPAIVRRLNAADRPLRRMAARVAARCAAHHGDQVLRAACEAGPVAEVALRIVLAQRRGSVDLPTFHRALALWNDATGADPSDVLDIVRLAQLALGDVGGGDGLPPVYDGYANGHTLQPAAAAARPFLEARFPTGTATVDHELTRLIALLAVDSTVLFDRLVQRLTDQSDPVEDLHHLIVLSRLPSAGTDVQREQIGSALLGLESKLASAGLSRDSHWDVRVSEMYDQLARQDPRLSGVVVRHPDFGHPGHLLFARSMAPAEQVEAAARVVAYLDTHPGEAWTSEIILFVARCGARELRARLRDKFDDPALQSAVLQATASSPDPRDRAWYVLGLSSPDWALIRAAVTALERLPASEDPDEQFALLLALRRLGADAREASLRRRVTRLLLHNLGPDYDWDSEPAAAEPAAQVETWTAYLRSRFPEAAGRHLRSAAEQADQLRLRLAQVEWEAGSAARGASLFRRQSCAGCHSTRTAVGPDLAGVTRRFSRDDVFTALLFPNRDVSPQYHTVLVETTRGHVVGGVVIYESVDGLTLRDSTNQTIRIAADELEMRRELATSLMPEGLLDGLTPQDLADLYAYLQTL